MLRFQKDLAGSFWYSMTVRALVNLILIALLDARTFAIIGGRSVVYLVGVVAATASIQDKPSTTTTF